MSTLSTETSDRVFVLDMTVPLEATYCTAAAGTRGTVQLTTVVVPIVPNSDSFQILFLLWSNMACNK